MIVKADNPQPRYRQLAEQLIAEIRASKLQVGQTLAAGRLLVLQGLHRERDFELGHIAHVAQALGLAGDVAGADVNAPLSREVRHGQSPLRAVG